MDNGNYKFIYTSHEYQITDEGEYFAVHRDYKQIAAFKDKLDAYQYVVEFLEHRGF